MKTKFFIQGKIEATNVWQPSINYIMLLASLNLHLALTADRCWSVYHPTSYRVSRNSVTKKLILLGIASGVLIGIIPALQRAGSLSVTLHETFLVRLFFSWLIGSTCAIILLCGFIYTRIAWNVSGIVSSSWNILLIILEYLVILWTQGIPTWRAIFGKFKVDAKRLQRSWTFDCAVSSSFWVFRLLDAIHAGSFLENNYWRSVLHSRSLRFKILFHVDVLYHIVNWSIYLCFWKQRRSYYERLVTMKEEMPINIMSFDTF